jgi:hypothetical protein
VQKPAPKHGSCTVVHPVIANAHGKVTATVDWSCEGSVVMVLKLRLAFDGNNSSREDLGVEEGSPVTVNYPPDTPPAHVTAPCNTSGYWRVNMVGTVDDLGSTIVLKSGTAPFNTPNWMVPTYVAC